LSWHLLSQRLFRFLRQDWISCLLFFTVGLVLRGVPELLVSWYPVGYETVTYYAPAMLGMVGKSLFEVLVEFFRAGPLFYVLMWFPVNVGSVHPFVVLKVVGPLLYGCLAASFFVFVRRGLRLDWKLTFVATLLLVFQVAALREGWDRFRTVLGLVFVFSALTLLRSSSRRKWWSVGGLAVLAVFSREYVALVLFVVVLGLAVWERHDAVKSVVALAPALLVFGVVAYLGLAGLVWSNALDASRGYLWVMQDAFVIFLVCYVGLLPFAVYGLLRRRDNMVSLMVAWLFFASFSVVFGWFAVPGYQRWLMFLVFPFCVCAVWGFEAFGLFKGRRLWALAAVLLVFVVVGAGYSTGAYSYVSQFPNSYVTVNLVQSSVGWSEVDDVKAVLGWLDNHAASGSSVLTEECFYGWTLMYLERANADVRVIPYPAASSPSSALELALNEASNRVYMVWFTEQNVEGFEIVFSWRSVSVFEFVSFV
jgi:hypothetical protein